MSAEKFISANFFAVKVDGIDVNAGICVIDTLKIYHTNVPSRLYFYIYKHVCCVGRVEKYEKVGVLPIRIVKFNVSSVFL